MVRNRCALAGLLLALAGCAYRPPAPAVIPVEQPVDASADATWSAVVDYFAEQHIPAQTFERASGYVAAQTRVIDGMRYLDGVDCGGKGRTGFLPDLIDFNVRVKPDGAGSTMRVNILYSRVDGRPCHSTGAWEKRLTAAVVRRVAGIR